MPTKKTRKSFVYFIYVSMSPTFYDQLFQTKVFRAAFLYIQFVFVVFKQKKIVKNVGDYMTTISVKMMQSV
jgi:hypothetical protein